MELQFEGNKPIFQQIADWLANAIIRGDISEEGQIPSITEFSVNYKINPATALKGVNLLVEAGLLYKKRGLGMFVASGAREKLLQQRRQSFYQDFILPLLTEAQQVQLTKEELMQMIERGYPQNDD